MCGAPCAAAHRSEAPTAYEQISSEPRTPASQHRPSGLSTCSPKTTGGLRWATSRHISGHRCRSSASHACPQALHIAWPVRRGHQTRCGLSQDGQTWRLPADENGGHGQLPVQTGRSSGHPASRRLSDQTPIPANRWICVKSRRSSGCTSRISRSSTSPSVIRPADMRLRSHCAAKGSCSL